MDVELPAGVLAALADGEDVVLVDLVSTPIVGSSGAATENLTRLAGRLRVGADEVRSFSLVRKLVTPLTAGRHAVAATDPRTGRTGSVKHWPMSPACCPAVPA